MSRTYKSPEEVPNEVLAARLRELASFITKPSKADHERLPSEFYMRIPAEVDHDADIVFCEAARRLTRSGSQGAVDDAMVERACVGYVGQHTYDRVRDDKVTMRDLRRDMRDALLAAMGGKGDGLDVMKIVGFCHEIQDAARRRETKSGGTITCAELAGKILNELRQPLTTISEERTPK